MTHRRGALRACIAQRAPAAGTCATPITRRRVGTQRSGPPSEGFLLHCADVEEQLDVIAREPCARLDARGPQRAPFRSLQYGAPRYRHELRTLWSTGAFVAHRVDNERLRDSPERQVSDEPEQTRMVDFGRGGPERHERVPPGVEEGGSAHARVPFLRTGVETRRRRVYRERRPLRSLAVQGERARDVPEHAAKAGTRKVTCVETDAAVVRVDEIGRDVRCALHCARPGSCSAGHIGLPHRSHVVDD